jgi:threonine synthase
VSAGLDHVAGLRCTLCKRLYPYGSVEYVCPDDGGNLDVEYVYDRIQEIHAARGIDGGPGMWRYKGLMPIDPGAEVPPLMVGDTPLYKSEILAKRLEVGAVWIKDDGRNPTASLKDRASALIVAKARAEGHQIITTASTGNAAAALAGLAASVQLPVVIFVPASAPPAKITQLLAYGAHVLLVEGTYDDAFDLCLEATERFGWYCRNTGYNPFTAEGKKTVSFEICEQIASSPAETFHPPDWIVVSVGDGNIISGVHKGLKDLFALGWIDDVPHLLGVQAEGSAALYNAWKRDLDPADLQPIEASTIADSISAGLPRDAVKATNAVKGTGGAFLAVSDAAILAAIPDLARHTGVFAEPAAAAAFAGLLKASGEGLFKPEDEIVLLVTGNGLKDVASAQKAVGSGYRVKPDMNEVSRVIGKIFGS